MASGMVFIGLQIKWTMLIMKRSNLNRYDTTIEEQFSYIYHTLFHSKIGVFHRLFHKKLTHCGKHGK